MTRDKQTIRSSDSSAPCSGPYNVHDLDANPGTLIGTLLVGVRGAGVSLDVTYRTIKREFVMDSLLSMDIHFDIAFSCINFPIGKTLTELYE